MLKLAQCMPPKQQILMKNLDSLQHFIRTSAEMALCLEVIFAVLLLLFCCRRPYKML